MATKKMAQDGPMSFLRAAFAIVVFSSASGCGTNGIGSPLLTNQGRTKIEELLLREDAFPPGWTESHRGPEAPEDNGPLGGGPAPIEATKLHFVVPADGGSGGAFEEVSRFWTRADAADAFSQTESEFFDDERETWAIPPALSEWRPNAAGWRVGCISNDIPRCHFVAQYGEYLVGFNIHTAAFNPDLHLVEVATMDQVLALLQEIDDTMTTVAQEH